MCSVPKGLRTLLLIALLAGCTPDAYRRSADLQVNNLLKDRKQETLGYSPQAVAPVTVSPALARPAYQKLPITPIAPPTTAPIEPLGEQTPFGPLGPELFWMAAGPIGAELPELAALRENTLLTPLGPSLPARAFHSLDLFACIRYAVQHSRAYQDPMEDLYLAALSVTLERHLLSPRPFVQENVNLSAVRDDVDFRSAYNAATSVGVRQKLPYGGEVVARTLVDFVRALSDSAADADNARLVLSGSLPLLRGAGMINLEPLINSERQMVYQVRAFEDYRRSFAVDIASRYFQLLTQQQGVINRKLNLRNTQNLTERSRALFQAGKANFLEVQRALQAQLSAEAALINSQAAYARALDDFKQALGMPIDEQLDVVAVALDVNVPRITEDQAVALAYQYRLSLRTASDKIDDARRALDNSKNGLLPTLDLTGSIEIGNQPDYPLFGAHDRTENYGAGLTLDLPVDRVAERNAYRRALINLQRSQRAFVSVKDSITADVRDVLRGIRSAEINVEIQRRGIELAKRRLDNANELLKQGKIGNRDVVDAQNSLLDAQDNYEQARGLLQIRVLEFMRATGTLRVDPQAGAIGRAMDRDAPATQPVNAATPPE